MSVQMNTMKVRFNYPRVFEPNEKSKKYECTILIPKDDAETLRRIKEACKTIYEEERSSSFRGLDFSEVAKPYHDGDGRKPKGGAYGDECKGMYVLNARSKNKPKVFTADKALCDDPTKVYSGCYGRANITFYAYNQEGGRGIGCALNGLMTFNYGEAIGGASVSESTWDDGFVDDSMSDDLGL